MESPLSIHIHPLEVLVEPKLIAFSDTPFELTDVFLLVPGIHYCRAYTNEQRFIFVE